jgi:hypothetical protein
VRRHGLAHRAGDGVQQLRLVEQRRAAPVAIDRGRRAAEIQIDPGRASRTSWAALSAMQAGSDPSSWTRTGVPLDVALPLRSSGTAG